MDKCTEEKKLREIITIIIVLGENQTKSKTPQNKPKEVKYSCNENLKTLKEQIESDKMGKDSLLMDQKN